MAEGLSVRLVVTPEDREAANTKEARRGKMVFLRKTFKRFVRDERGLETVEYAVMTALIVAALVLAIGLLTGAISARFDAVRTVISGI